MDPDPNPDGGARMAPPTRGLPTLSTAIAVAMILCGCGRSSESAPTTTVGTSHATMQRQSGGPSAPAGSARAARGAGGGSGADAPNVSRQVFASKANAACRAVRGATPASGPGVPAQGRERLGNAVVLERTIDVLLRLRPPPPPSLRPQIAHLLTSLQRLRQIDAAPAPDRRRTSKRSGALFGFPDAERRAAGEALAAGLPDCFPVPGGDPDESIGR